MLAHHVIFLFEQDISPGRQIAFARRFGEIESTHPVFDVLDSHSKITLIEQDGTPESLYSDDWHTDVTFREKPAMASILHCQVTPSVGGDTGWLSLAAAYDALSDSVKRFIEGMRARHDVYKAFGSVMLDAKGGMALLQEKQREFPPVDHPVVRTHPETGRKCLFVNRAHTMRINGLQDMESRHLLEMLGSMWSIRTSRFAINGGATISRCGITDAPCIAQHLTLPVTV